MNRHMSWAKLAFGAALALLPIFGLAQVPSASPAGLQAAAQKALAEKAARTADDTPHVSVQPGIVQVRIHNVTAPAYVPLESLASVIKRHPNVNLYRVTWGCFYGRHSSKSTVLYDRRQHSLRYNCKGFSSPWGNFYKHTAFGEVTDKVLVRDARDHRVSTRQMPFDRDVDVIFDNLASYGCVRHDFPPPAAPKVTVAISNGVVTRKSGRNIDVSPVR